MPFLAADYKPILGNYIQYNRLDIPGDATTCFPKGLSDSKSRKAFWAG